MQRKKLARLAVFAVAALIVLYLFPLVRVRKLDPSESTTSQLKQRSNTDAATKDIDRDDDTEADTASFLETLWTDRLPESADKAVSAEEVLEVAATDPARARKTFGREVGLGGPTFLYVRGTGTIESIDKDKCRLLIEGHPQRISLAMGILFGNAVRDATGLVSVDDFPNSQEFNRLSAELNALCESEVIQPLTGLLHFDVSSAVVVYHQLARARCCVACMG